LQVNCNKDGYIQTNLDVMDSMNGITFINAIFWPGFIVDAVSGSMQKYPKHLVVQMKKSS